MYLLKYLLTLYIFRPLSFSHLSQHGQRFSQFECLFSQRYTFIPVLCHALRPRKSLFAKLQHLLQPLRVHVRRAVPTPARGSIFRISTVSIILNEGSTHRHVQFRANKVNTISPGIRPRASRALHRSAICC